MKSLFVPIFAVLTVVAQAELPMGVPKPLKPLETLVTPIPYTADKPTDLSMSVPKPLEPLAPTFPKQDPAQEEEATPMLILGQDRTVDGLKSILDEPPPIPKGLVEEGTIPSALTGGEDADESVSDIWGMDPAQKFGQKDSAGQGTTSTDDPLGNAALLAMTVIAVLGLAYMAFVAYDYHQRWVQALTVQNDRYLGGGFELEAEDSYGSSVAFSESFGLPRRSM